MDQLLLSRINKPEETTQLDNLSPEKFGRSAYAKLNYTPSKLAGTVLYKEVSQMKKTEENSNKLRQYEALNKIQKDKIRHLQSEKESIEGMLNQQISMYKKMIAELQEQLEQRVKDLQANFAEQIQKIIQDKDEQARYVQSEKQLLENRIQELEEYIAELKQQLSKKINLLDRKTQDYDNLEVHYKSSCEKNKELENNIKQRQETHKRQIDEIIRKYDDQQSAIKAQAQKQILLIKDQMKEAKKSFEDEKRKLNESLTSKDQLLRNLNNQLNEQKEKLLNITKQFMIEITNLKNQKKMLDQSCQTLQQKLKTEQEELKKARTASTQTSNFIEQKISSLQQDLQAARANLMKQHERNYKEKEQIKKQIQSLKKIAQQSTRLSDQNALLCKQIRNLKDLLLESSLEMQRSKDQFFKVCSEKELLITKLQELDLQNETLHRINIEREEEAKTWRESYYKYRR